MASIYSIFLFILLTVMLFHVTNSEIISFNASSHESGRAKRVLPNEMPYLLEIQFKYRSDKQINLLWKQKKPMLVNKYLPILIPTAGFNKDLMTNIGEFVLYHDAVKCSAVVYFHKLNVFYGVIGTNYRIENLPFDLDEAGNHRLGLIGEPFIQKYDQPRGHIDPHSVIPPPSDVQAWNDYLRPFNHELVQNPRPSKSCNAISSAGTRRMKRNYDDMSNGQQNKIITKTNNTMMRKRRNAPVDRIFYLEILVFVSRDMAEQFKYHYGESQYIEWLVKYLIVYFNAADTMFQQLSITGLQLYLNIAQIVIEDASIPFNFLSGDVLEFGEVTTKVSKYLEENRQLFPPDSFDHVFIYTSRTIMDGVIEVDGITKHGADIYEARGNNRFYDAVPITALQFQYHFADYPVAVHEIGRILNFRIDPKEMGWRSSEQCYSIMQRGGSKCDGCLTWTNNIINQFIHFFTQNRNRCFLLNMPRSIRPPGPSQSVSPFGQCRCYGDFRHTNLRGKSQRFVRVDECSDRLHCTVRDFTWRYVALSVTPLDGTPCSLDKVCWNGECILKNS